LGLRRSSIFALCVALFGHRVFAHQQEYRKRLNRCDLRRQTPIFFTLGLLTLAMSSTSFVGPSLGINYSQPVVEIALGFLMVIPVVIGFRYSGYVSQLTAMLTFSFLFVVQELTQRAIS
jgi:hypothetical protein